MAFPDHHLVYKTETGGLDVTVYVIQYYVQRTELVRAQKCGG